MSDYKEASSDEHGSAYPSRSSTAIPVQELLDYLKSEQEKWYGVNADRYWQTTLIVGFVQGLGLREAVSEWMDRDPVMQEFFHGKAST